MPAQTGIQRTLLLLTKTHNSAAIDVLDAGVRARDSSIRCAAAKALAKRTGRPSAFALLRALPEVPADVSRVCGTPDLRRRLRPAATEAILSDDAELAARARDYAEKTMDTYLAAAMVQRATKVSQDRRQFSQTVLKLVEAIAQALTCPPLEIAKPTEDPAFPRRAVLTALGPAVESFGDHRQTLLIDAYLMLVASNDPRLARILHDSTHQASSAIHRSLATSKAPGVMRLLAENPLQERPCKVRLDALQGRMDFDFLDYWTTAVGERPAPRLVETLRKLDGFAWLEEAGRPALTALSGEQQATALRLAAATRASRRKLMDLAALLLCEGETPGRVGAVEMLAGINAAEAAELASQALSDEDPTVSAAARRMLRLRGYQPDVHDPPATPPANQPASQAPVLPSNTFRAYRDHFAKLDPEARQSLGRLVQNEDPSCPAELRIEFRAVSPARRVRAIEMTSGLGLLDELADELIDLLADGSARVRAAAAKALAGSVRDDVIAGFTQVLQDVDEAVREIAARSLAMSNPPPTSPVLRKEGDAE